MNEKTNFEDFVPQIISHTFRKCSPDWRIRTSMTSGYELLYVIKGSARYTINNVTHELESGDLLYVNKGDKRAAISHHKNLMHCYETIFLSKYPQIKKAGSEKLFPTVNHIGLRQDVIGMFRELSTCWNEQQSGYSVKAQALFMLILHRLSEIILYDIDSAPGDYRISKITRYITMHYSEKLTVTELADQVHLDPDYFGHLFKRETGMKVQRYINQTRIQYAETLLQSGNYKIYEVAANCGFSDVYHFYKSFKALRGFPPSRCIPPKT